MPSAMVNAFFFFSLLSFSVSIVSSNASLKDGFRFINNTSSRVNRSISFLVTMSPEASIVYLIGHSGYCNMSNVKGERMFYYFFNERAPKENSPVAIWLTGVPGLSSSVSIFYENGPFEINGDHLSLQWRKFGWDQLMHMIYVDEPIGTGFSETQSLRSTKADIVNDLYNFLKVFFFNKPNFKNKDFFILGQSYAGGYGLALAAQIQRRNPEIKLRGIAIGNGLINPSKQFNSIPIFLEHNRVLNADIDRSAIESKSAQCQTSIAACESDETQCIQAHDDCGRLLAEISDKEINLYNFKEPDFGNRLHYDFSDVAKFLNKQSIKNLLQVPDFYIFKGLVYDKLRGELMKNSEEDVIYLLENEINVLIYAGERDIICNWEGNLKWVNELQWSQRTQFVDQADSYLEVEGIQTGYMKWYGPLSFASIYDAGHMVAMDQPAAAIGMLQVWMDSIRNVH